MQVQSLPQLRVALGVAASSWFPLAVASSLWLLMLMFGGASIGSLPPGIPLVALAPWQMGILLAVIGFLAVGLFASPFDAPRLTALFLAVLGTGLHAVPAASATADHRRPSLPWRRRRQGKSRRKSAANSN